MKQFCESLLATKDAIIVDTETTGLGRSAEAVQLSIIDLNGRIVFNHLLRPFLATIEPGAAAVTGITNDMVKGLPTLLDYMDALRPLKDRVAIAYNADFDRRICAQTAAASGSAELVSLLGSWRWEDVMVPYADYWGDWSRYHGNNRWQKLTAACRQQGIVIKDAHDALGDVRMTLALVKKLAGVS